VLLADICSALLGEFFMHFKFESAKHKKTPTY